MTTPTPQEKPAPPNHKVALPIVIAATAAAALGAFAFATQTQHLLAPGVDPQFFAHTFSGLAAFCALLLSICAAYRPYFNRVDEHQARQDAAAAQQRHAALVNECQAAGFTRQQAEMLARLPQRQPCGAA